MPEKKIVEMPAEVTVIVDKVSEVTQSKDYGYDGSGWVPKKVDSSGRTEVTQTSPLNLMGVTYSGLDDSSVIHLIKTDDSGRPRIVLEQDSIGLAKDTTLSSIDGKITKCDTDNTTVSKRVSDSFSHGQVDVGTSAVQLTSSSTPCKFGVVIKADDDNSGNVYIGGSGVTTSNGFRLKAGQGISFEIDDASKVYAIADSTGQKVHWIAV
ncbi:MAG: hypothetical protein B6U94_06970 [Thermofilum sp. ex4484_79]|nr:MAG: hypothetical protein B6U94_06970 [Thermofilum sp. ex4484_79]